VVPFGGAVMAFCAASLALIILLIYLSFLSRNNVAKSIFPDIP
jgi:VIT1/CCC1 family predicted Fe2+/Mn2+ transporter